MTLEQCYMVIGADYEGVIERLLSEARVRKYLMKFCQDDSAAKLEAALREENYEEAFRCAHNLKGICLNLGLEKCHQSGSELCEALRDGRVDSGRMDEINRMFEAVKNDYQAIVDAAGELDEE